MSGRLAGYDTDSFQLPELFAGDGAVRTKNSTFASGLNLAANAVIARNTSTGQMTQWDPAGVNGTNIAVGITVEAVNTTGGAANHPYYFSGDFNIDALVWIGGATATQKELAFDRSPISVRALAG